MRTTIPPDNDNGNGVNRKSLPTTVYGSTVAIATTANTLIRSSRLGRLFRGLPAVRKRLAAQPPETEFARGIRHFGMMITWLTMLLVLFGLLVNIILHRPLLESFLFSVALAVRMTPEMMPMIITVTLAEGARRMTKKNVLVKQMAAIERNFCVTPA